MNKQEAIEKIKDLYNFVMEDGPFEVDLINKNQAIDIISQIDEPQKVVVPKFIAEWIEECKSKGVYLCTAMSNDENKTFYWLNTKEKQDIFARAWLDGDEIEQEKLYTVEIPNNGGTLVLASIRYAIQLVDSNKHFPGKFTKESIEEAGFGWVFDCNGVKVVEVE